MLQSILNEVAGSSSTEEEKEEDLGGPHLLRHHLQHHHYYEDGRLGLVSRNEDGMLFIVDVNIILNDMDDYSDDLEDEVFDLDILALDKIVAMYWVGGGRRRGSLGRERRVI